MTRFTDLLPPTAFVAEATDQDWRAALMAEEAVAVTNAVDSRVREFAAGRNCARRALQLAGHEACSIPVGTGRAPVFPPGYSGTITHTHGYCAAAVLAVGEFVSIGIDAETNEPLEQDLIELIAGSAERAMLAAVAARTPGNWAKLLFSAKESFFKAYYQVCPSYLDFQDAAVAIDVTQRSFHITVLRGPGGFQGARFVGRFHLDDNLICTAIALKR